MNVTFIGMSGAGKSYIGKAFAGAMKMDFIDIDTQMERQYSNRPLQEILDELGKEQFLKEQEDQVLMLKKKDDVVISPGGSVIYTDRAMDFLKKFSSIVYLDVPLAIIKERIHDTSRGIVGLNEKTFDELYQERSGLYKKWADITIYADEKKRGDVIAEVKRALARSAA